MRQLRVVGLGDDGETVIVEDPVRHERFSVPGDERLRAAARGDIRRLGQMEIEHTSPLRPRDIQARIRAGESVDQVASGGGVSVSHVERFAYPVLLERARVAEMAGRAHPLRAADPPHHAAEWHDPRTLGEIVAATFVARGQDYDEAAWDAWKGDDAQWAVVLSWQAGRSDNTASWTYRPGSGGGVVIPRDDHARDLVGETPTGPRRVDDGSERAPERTTAPTEDPATGVEGSAVATDDPQESFEEIPAALAASGDTAPPRHRGGSAGANGTSPARGARTGRSGAASRSSRNVPGPRDHRRADGAPRPRPGAHDPSPAAGDEAASPGTDTADASSPPATPPDTASEQTAPTRGSSRNRRNHPIVPSWEDVLLGTRSPRS